MFGVIGGTGLSDLAQLSDVTSELVSTAFGDAYLEFGNLNGVDVVFLPRHGHPPSNPPHRVNYRANIRALQIENVTQIIAVTAVGSCDPELEVGEVVIPDQIIDYTSGRPLTFFDDEISHVDFTYPYTDSLRYSLIKAASSYPDVRYCDSGVYGCTNGPRLETAAEVQRLYRDGCTIVGMTAMPEAVLAREAELDYAGISVVVNKGAGLAGALDLEEISETLDASMSKVGGILQHVIASNQ